MVLGLFLLLLSGAMLGCLLYVSGMLDSVVVFLKRKLGH